METATTGGTLQNNQQCTKMTKTYRFYCIAVLIVALAVLGQASRQRKVHSLRKWSLPHPGNVNADQQKEIKGHQEKIKKETQKLDLEYENHQKREQNIKAKEEEIKAREKDIKAKEKEVKNIIIQNLNFKAKQIETKKKCLIWKSNKFKCNCII